MILLFYTRVARGPECQAGLFLIVKRYQLRNAYLNGTLLLQLVSLHFICVCRNSLPLKDSLISLFLVINYKQNLCCPATSAQSERDFSHTGLILTSRRSLISPKYISSLEFIAAAHRARLGTF